MGVNKVIKCSCGDGASINNYGVPNCFGGIDVPQDVIFLSQFEDDGTTINGIDIVTDVLNEAFFDGKFKNENVTERWLMIEDVEAFESTPADANVFTFPSGTIRKLSEGIRTVVMAFPSPDPNKLKDKLDALACRKLSVMYHDRSKSLVGQCIGDFVAGRQIVPQSFEAKVFDKTDGDAGKVEVSFQYSRAARDAKVDFIEETQFGGYSLDSVIPLQDVNIEYISGVAAQLVFKLFFDYGPAGSREPAPGLTTTHLDITADGVVEALSSLTETPDGTYTAVYTVPVSIGEVMEVRGITALYVQLSYDLKRLIGQTFTTTA